MDELQLSYVEDDERKAAKNRISRLIGQLKGIQKMIDEDRTCEAILVQLSSVQNGTKNISNFLLDQSTAVQPYPAENTFLLILLIFLPYLSAADQMLSRNHIKLH